MNKEVERNYQLSLVSYILVVPGILIKLHLGPNWEVYNTQKGEIRVFTNKPVRDKSVNQSWLYFNFHTGYW